MGFVVLHIKKPKGNDARTTAHIERTVHPANADPERTHLNRELIQPPDGVENRTQAIQHRIENAGITRKIGTNQVRALRVGGYEFLVIVDKISLITEREEMQDFVHHRYPPSERFEQRFFIHLFSREFFISNVRRNHFLKDVLTEGIELHNTGLLPLENINLRKSVKSKYRQWIASQAERCLHHADLLLEDAEGKTITCDTRLSGFYLYFALEQVLMALEYRQYGFRREYDHISRRFQVAIHGSAALSGFFESRRNEILKMFKVLKKLRDDSLYCETYGTPDDTIYRYMDLVQKMKKLVE